MMPPMRPRAGTTLMLSTVANTAFSSATGRKATVRVSAPAQWRAQSSCGENAQHHQSTHVPSISGQEARRTATPSSRGNCRGHIDLPQNAVAFGPIIFLFGLPAFAGAQ